MCFLSLRIMLKFMLFDKNKNKENVFGMESYIFFLYRLEEKMLLCFISIFLSCGRKWNRRCHSFYYLPLIFLWVLLMLWVVYFNFFPT